MFENIGDENCFRPEFCNTLKYLVYLYKYLSQCLRKDNERCLGHIAHMRTLRKAAQADGVDYRSTDVNLCEF